MKKCSLKKWCLLGMFVLLLPIMTRAEVDSGYEAAKGSGSCPAEGTFNNPLHYDYWGFVKCNCTSYVAYRLRLNDVKFNGTGELFDNTWGPSSVYFGYAYNWNNGAATAGVREDQYPAVGSVAHWERVTATTADDGITDFGHVAYVQRLWTRATDGRLESIDVMEYNWSSPYLYDYRNISIGGRGYPTSFLHFEEFGRDAAATNATCVTGVAPPSGVNAGTFCWVHNGSNANCANAIAYYHYDYHTCQKYTVNSSSCASVGSNRGYTAHIDNWFPEPIDPAHWGDTWAACDVGGNGGYGGAPAQPGFVSIIKYVLE